MTVAAWSVAVPLKLSCAALAACGVAMGAAAAVTAGAAGLALLRRVVSGEAVGLTGAVAVMKAGSS